MNNSARFFKTKRREYLWDFSSFLLVLLILFALSKINIVRDSIRIKSTFLEWDEIIKSLVNIFTVIYAIDFAINIDLQILTGQTRRTIFTNNIKIMVLLGIVYSLFITLLGVLGVNIKVTGMLFTQIGKSEFYKYFIDYFLQFLLIYSLAGFISYSFKKNYILGGVIVGVLVVYVWGFYNFIPETETLVNNLIFSLPLLLIGTLGSKVIIDNY
ncbi:hypothetical protein [Miniphocaeibacter halophilus]|uniref:Uncharacterized protein n=1 Tax=Miniphocaeibacter halophilus TaxID=2931922 RepID=A0AC61MSE1_9FIRM|nr:hypothetical protein [Miniphocaeibacter halophilus]QQK08233.1 hypothetical protein JFY71_01460 [Miniphocaeibacter halophilus]